MTDQPLIRRYMPLRLKKILGKVLSNSLTGNILSIIYRNKIPFHGVTVNTECKARIRRKTVSDLLLKIYERAEIDQVRAHLSGEYDVIELGGSIGVNTMQIKKKLHPGRKLIVVEADPELAEILKLNLDQNDLCASVTVLNAAIDYSGASTVKFSVSKSNLSGRVASPVADAVNTVEVGTTQLCKLLKEFNIAKFALVSDIEGMEIPIFLEDKASLQNCEQIFLEIDGVNYKQKSYSVNDIVSNIEQLGFKVIDRYHNCVTFQKR